MAEFDLQRFLDTPIYALDFQSMIGDIKDYLEFSEHNLDWQYRREIRSIAQRTDIDEASYLDHLQRNAEHRFRVSLPLRLRYGALVALVTSIEWAATYLNDRADLRISDRQPAFAVKVLRELATSKHLDLTDVIDDVEALCRIRNCITHSAGVVGRYRYKVDLPAAVSRFDGISIADWHFFGSQICIDRNALDAPIDRTTELIGQLHQAVG